MTARSKRTRRSAAVVLVLSTGLAVVACVTTPAPTTPATGILSASGNPPVVASSSPRPTLPPMAQHYGPWICGTVKAFGATPAQRERIRQGGDACFIHQDCEHLLPGEPVTEDCPDLPMLSVEQLVRTAEQQPTEQEVIVTGRLVLANGHIGPGFAPYPPPRCGGAAYLTALTAEVEGTCYAVDLGNDATRCTVDASAACCPWIPLWHEAAVAGRLHRGEDRSSFQFWSDGRVCRLGPDGKPPRKAPKPAASGEEGK